MALSIGPALPAVSIATKNGLTVTMTTTIPRDAAFKLWVGTFATNSTQFKVYVSAGYKRTGDVVIPVPDLSDADGWAWTWGFFFAPEIRWTVTGTDMDTQTLETFNQATAPPYRTASRSGSVRP